MINGKEAVFFDLDGTLIDSMWVWEQIDIDYLSRYQIPSQKNIHEDIEGMSFTQTAEYFKNRFQIPDTVEQIMQCWNEMAYDKYINDVPLKKGVKELLCELKKRDIKTGVATSNSRHLVEAVLRKHGIAEKFDSIITSCEINKGKPEPDIYLRSADKVGVSPKNCLVFEDIPMGILAGSRAGMEVCAVKDDFSDYCLDKKRELADYMISDYFEVLDGTYEVLKK